MGIAVAPDNPDVIYVANTTTWKSTDAGKTFVGLRERRAATITSASGSIPQNRQTIALTADQGAAISVNGGTDVEQLVQPAHRTVLSRDHRQSFPLLGLWRAAGKRKRGHAKPQRLRRDHFSRLELCPACSSMATSPSIPRIPILFMARNLRAPTRLSAKWPTSRPNPFAAANIATIALCLCVFAARSQGALLRRQRFI